MHLSSSAVSEIKRLKSKQHPQVFFRLGVRSGGCCGWFYEMSFDQVVKDGDRVLECDDIQVVTDAQSLNYINGLTLDYSEDLMGGGFRFHNPIAITLCGCGNSFSIG